MSFPAPSAFPDGKIVSDSLPADLWTFLQTSCDFPAKILRISCGGLLQGQADGKGDPVVRAGSPDRPAVEGNDFLGYGQAKARAARAKLKADLKQAQRRARAEIDAREEELRLAVQERKAALKAKKEELRSKGKQLRKEQR